MRGSRRARLVLTILLLAAFTLVTLDYRSGALGGVRSAANTVFGPVESAVGDVVHPIGSWFSSIGHLGSYKHDNQQLKRQVGTLQNELHLTDRQRSELTQLRKIDHLAGQARFTVVHATISAVGPLEDFEWTATIDRGSANGIAADETVIDGDGLVGRVTTVGRNTSTILLANDPSSNVGVRVAGSGEIGYVTGGGRGAMTLTLLSNTAQLKVGDRLVTYANKPYKPYVPEVPFGHIVSVTPPNGTSGRTAQVVPYVNYTALEDVAVVVAAPPSVKRDSLLPPSPTPTPTPTVTVTKTVTAKPSSSP